LHSMERLSIKDDDGDDDIDDDENDEKLEALAVSFQEEMYRQNLVKDRMYHLKTYHNCFTGRDAVNVLVQVLQQRQQQQHQEMQQQHQQQQQQFQHVVVTVSREDALQVGRNIAATFGLMAHVVDDHLLQDTDGLFFEFRNNLPSVVRQATTNKSTGGMPLTLWEQSEQFETLVRDTITKDRTYHFRTYKQCFVGSEAVDVMMTQLKFTITRLDAVKLIQQFALYADALEHVCKDHDFKDQYLFYRFIPPRLRKLNPANRRESVMVFADGMMMRSNNSGTSSFGDDDLLDMSEVGSSSEHGGGGALLGRMSSSVSASSSVPSPLQPPVVDMKTLQDIAHRMERELPVGNHRYRFKIYTNCFVAKNAVTYLVQSGFADSRSHAERIGRDLELHLNLFHHVCREHGFRDKYYFFRFTPASERRKLIPSVTQVQRQPPVDPTATATTSSSASASVPEEPTGSRRQSFTCHLATRLGVEMALQDAHLTLEDIAKVFEKGIKVKDEYYHLKLYKNVFRGKRAVDFLVSLKSVCTNRRDAVLLGRLLAEQCHLFTHITRDHELVDDDDFLYQFVAVEERQRRLCRAVRVVESKSTATIIEELLEDDALRSEDGEDGVHDDHDEPQQQQQQRQQQQQQSPPPDERSMEVAMIFRDGVKIANNRYRGKMYKRTFVGSQAVNFLVNSSLATSRKEAVKLGRRLADEMNLFEHVYKQHPFSDDFYFYRFIEKDQDAKHDSKGCLITSFFSNTAPHSSSSFNSSEASLLEDNTISAVTPSNLIQAAQAMEEGLKPKDHRFHLRVYKNTVLGSEIVDLLLARQLASSRPQALLLGRAVLREFQLLEHVTLDHGLKDERLCYKFVPRPNRIKGKWFEESHEGKVREKMIMVGRKRSHCSTSEYWNIVMNMVVRDIWKFQVESIITKPVREYHVESEDHEWVKRVKEFELRQSKLPSLHMSTLTITQQATFASPRATMPYRRWSFAFRKLDPRYQIMDFFTEVARTGTQPIEAGLTRHSISLLDELRPLLRFFPLNLASVFTVWRPTSYDAIRKMMTGDAVGKGIVDMPLDLIY
jgi:Domain found in Dishevelled, Egl-10, and Pleckstrin (DEP)